MLNADTLYILTPRERLPALLRPDENWAGEVSWPSNDHLGFASREEFERDGAAASRTIR